MPGRTRTAKKLAQRIDLNYFKRLYPIPRWRRILSFAAAAAALLWLAWAGSGARQQIYNAGPLSRPHALFTRNCAACHMAPASFRRMATNSACLACHDGPIHQTQQTFTPACQDCHVEHQGAARLSEVRDEACTQCHANLKSNNGRPAVAAKITSFASDHPQFAAMSRPDPGTVKLNHKVHLSPNLRGQRGPVQLQCSDCHQRDGPQMLAVNYEKHCASCHPLQFDATIADPAPHRKPEIVVDFITAKFTAYIAAHPDEVHLADPADPRIMRPPLPPARDAAEWVSRRVSDAKQLLWRKSCAECHALTFRPAAPLPEVPAANITAHWFPKASFDHEAHRFVTCTGCHSKASVSRETSDVLVPGIETCRECHQPGSDSAESRCFECHVYHDWSKEKPVEGRFTIAAIHQ